MLRWVGRSEIMPAGILESPTDGRVVTDWIAGEPIAERLLDRGFVQEKPG